MKPITTTNFENLRKWLVPALKAGGYYDVDVEFEDGVNIDTGNPFFEPCLVINDVLTIMQIETEKGLCWELSKILDGTGAWRLVDGSGRRADPSAYETIMVGIVGSQDVEIAYATALELSKIRIMDALENIRADKMAEDDEMRRRMA